MWDERSAKPVFQMWGQQMYLFLKLGSDLVVGETLFDRKGRKHDWALVYKARGQELYLHYKWLRGRGKPQAGFWVFATALALAAESKKTAQAIALTSCNFREARKGPPGRVATRLDRRQCSQDMGSDLEDALCWAGTC